MGTSGLLVFKKNDVEVSTYTHYDGNPLSLGVDALSYIKQQGIKMIEEKFLKCKVVNHSSIPTICDILNLKVYTNIFVASKSENDWYCLTYETQGNIRQILNSEYIFNVGPIKTYWNWKYVVNFDTQCFEIHKGNKLLYEIKFRVLRIIDYDMIEMLMEQLEVLA